MSKQKLYEIIKIIVTAILAVAATLLVEACTLSLSVSKNNSNSTQSTQQSTQVDSLNVQSKYN
jgi:outer membrane biogenesis lipoprotein LolB